MSFTTAVSSTGRQRKEDKLRLSAFGLYYKLFANEPDLTIRFAKAIVASSKPLPPGAAERWHSIQSQLAHLTDADAFALIAKSYPNRAANIGEAGRRGVDASVAYEGETTVYKRVRVK